MNLAGKLLISPPKVRGNFWQKAVIFLTENHNKGSVGLTLNKPSKMTIRDFARQHNVDIDVKGLVYVGGPVNVKAFTMLHSADWACDNTMQVNDQFALSSSPNMLHQLAMGNCPRVWRMFVGLAGWTAGQLENELAGTPPYDHNLSWLLARADQHTVFGLDGTEQWTDSIELSSSEFSQSVLA